MTPQLIYRLRKALVLAGIAALGVAADQLTTLPLDTNTAIIATALVGMALRVLEGIRDGSRAAEGKVIPSDVAFAPLDAKVMNENVHITVTPSPASPNITVGTVVAR